MKFHLIGIFILALVMIALPLHLRFAHNNPTLAGIEPYYHARMAIQLNSGIPEKDTAIFGGRPYVLNPYHAVLAIGYKIIGPLTFNLLPGIFAFASFVFLWLLLKKLEVPKHTQLWILIAYALSPPLITTGILGTPHSFTLVLFTAGAYLMLTRAWPLGSIFFITASLTGILYNITAIVFMTLLALVMKEKTRELMITAGISLLILIMGFHPEALPETRGIIQYVSDLGGTYGISIFAFLLAIVGAVLIWEHKKKYYWAYAIVILFLISSFFSPGFLVFANIIVSALAGIALDKLAERKWELKFLRQAALLVLFCGLLFSSISHAVATADTSPTPAFFKALEFSPGTILTHEQYGFWVEMAGHTAITDPLLKEVEDYDDRMWDSAAMLGSTDIAKTKQLMEKYGITHVLITPEMVHGLTWEREQQGLHFLVENSETFKRLETGSNIGVWQT